MPRPAKSTTPTKVAKKPAGRATSKTKPSTSKTQTAKAVASIKKTVKVKAPVVAPKKTPATRAPVIAKAELRASIEKLENTIATLRTKSRETNKALKAATARVAELETQLADAPAAAAKVSAPTAPAQVSGKKAAAKKSPAKKRTAAPDVAKLNEMPVVENAAPVELSESGEGE